MTNLTRIVIDKDRYNGTYSHAKFTAWFEFAPDEIDSDDIECSRFWLYHDPMALPCGKGDTPEEALRKLLTTNLGDSFINAI